jgi:hypothetical protein
MDLQGAMTASRGDMSTTLTMMTMEGSSWMRVEGRHEVEVKVLVRRGGGGEMVTGRNDDGDWKRLGSDVLLVFSLLSVD